MLILESNWGEMAFYASGAQSIPVVLLHGTGCDSMDWGPVVRCLSGETRVVTMDFRGHGESSMPADHFTLEDLAQDVLMLGIKLGLEKMLLVGHSLGGMVALDAARLSKDVAGLVLLEGWTSLSVSVTAFDGFGRDRLYGSLDRESIERIKRKYDTIRRRFREPVWDRFQQSVGEFDGAQFLRGAQIPILEVYGAMGRNDRTQGNLGVPENPLIEWVWIEGAGHYLPHERPLEVAQAVRSAMEKLNPSNGAK